MRRFLISRTSRKPLVVIRPVRAPLCSRIAFEATVVPWRTSATSAPSIPRSANSSARARRRSRGRSRRRSTTPSACARGRPRQQHDVGERAADVDADPPRAGVPPADRRRPERRHQSRLTAGTAVQPRAARSSVAQPRARRRIDRAVVVDHDAVVGARRLRGSPPRSARRARPPPGRAPADRRSRRRPPPRAGTRRPGGS